MANEATPRRQLERSPAEARAAIARPGDQLEIMVELLRLANQSLDARDMVRQAATFFQKRSGCQAVGIRLKEGDDFPYFEARGFSAEFVEAESHLCEVDSAGQIVRDESGHPVLECMCGRVIRGKVDPSKPFFTSRGSFWTNSTSQLLASTSQAERQGRTRNRCQSEGYESVALIRLVAGDQAIGLLQLNDRRKGMFTLEMLSVWEHLADQLAIALARLRAEERVRQSESRFQILSAATFEGIAITEAGRLMDANEQLARMLGYEPAELIGKEVSSLLPPEERQRVLQNIRLGRESHIEHKVVRKGGGTIIVEAHGKNVTSQGQTLRITALRDITQRKKAEDALRQSEARLRAFFEQAAVGAGIADPATGRFLRVNAKYCQITGYEAQELLGMTVWDVTHPEDRDVDRDRYNRLVSGAAQEYLAEKRYVRKDGRVVWVQVAVGMVRDAHGRAIQSVGVTQDITSRKQIEEALRESEKGLKAAQQIAHVGSWEWNVRNDVARWSDETFSIFGLPCDPLEQHHRSFVEMVHPDDRNRVDQALTEALSGTRDYDLDYRIVRPDGVERFIHAQAQVLRDAEGNPIFMRGTVHDITERKHTERQLQELNETLEVRVAQRTAEAEERAVQLQRLAAELARVEQSERRQLARLLHDNVQQLLVAAKFRATTLRNKMVDPDHLRSLRQMSELLDEVLATSRSLTAELSPPILYEGNLSQVLQWLGRWAKEHHGLSVLIKADEQANPESHDVRALLFQAVRELLLNVAKHAQVSQASITLRRQGRDWIQIVVADQGVGFDPAGKASEQSQGAAGGFGLFSIRQRLQWLGGTMEIASGPGHGTRVALLVPWQFPSAEATMGENGSAET